MKRLAGIWQYRWTRRALASLRSFLVVFLSIALLTSTVQAHVGHALDAEHQSFNSSGLSEHSNGSDPTEIDPDCSVNSACHGLILSDTGTFLAFFEATIYLPEVSVTLPGILAPPLPHPPNFS